MLLTRSVINEEVTSKLVRELKSENEKLRKMVSLGDYETNEYSLYRVVHARHLTSAARDTIKRKIMDDMKAQIRENDKEIRNLQQPLEERLKNFKGEKNVSTHLIVRG